ncbi:endonuclease domain-containing protein [Microbacterium sp. P05]|uniref:endonuclease domain-containing protein n=1 Tax=Microbacterium sp. P05 TaxID=3366948 RepID=UPI00374726D2
MAIRKPGLRPLLRGGIYLHRDDLLERGWRADAVRRAAKNEGLLLLRRQWIVAADAPADYIAAAQLGGCLTCGSGAAALNLWRPGTSTAIHLALPPHSSVATDGTHRHYSRGVVTRPARNLVDAIENILALSATCMVFEDALSVWESALNKGLVDRPTLEAIAWRGDTARRLCEEAGRSSDSGLESLAVRRLGRIGVRVLQQVVIGGRPVDGLVGARLVLQIDGFEHHSDARQRRSDIGHDRSLRLAGYTVLRYDYHQVINEWPRVEAEILRAMAQGLHLAPRA